MGLKGFTLTATSGGLIVYGGMYWQETNLTLMDEVYTEKNKYLEACRAVINERTNIEQASAAIDNVTYKELTLLDMGSDRWT